MCIKEIHRALKPSEKRYIGGVAVRSPRFSDKKDLAFYSDGRSPSKLVQAGYGYP
ncbi:MAG TPA: hypothetical protein PLL88_02675 [Anaerolineaceae bacterium]|nr:hypothetical protein [Anaerolineaceae bacterium]